MHVEITCRHCRGEAKDCANLMPASVLAFMAAFSWGVQSSVSDTSTPRYGYGWLGGRYGICVLPILILFLRSVSRRAGRQFAYCGDRSVRQRAALALFQL